MLPHLPGQVGQHLVSFAYLHFECSVPHTLDYSSINRDHVFFWNDVTSFPRARKRQVSRDVRLDSEVNDFLS